MPRRSRKPSLIVILTLLALALLVASFFLNQVQVIYRNLGAILAQELQTQLNRKVTIGHVNASRPGLLIAENVVIQQNPPSARPLIQVRRAEIRYNYAAILFRRQPVIQAITEVTLTRPRVFLARSAGGVLSIQDLLRPRPGPPRPAFQGVVVARDGEFTLADSYPRRGKGGVLVNRVVDLNGTLDARASPRLRLQGGFRGTQGRFDRAILSGLYNTRLSTLDVTVQVRNALAPYWWDYVTSARAIRPLSGRTDVDLRVTRSSRGRPLDYAANFRLRDVAATIPQFAVPVTGLSGRMALVGANVTMATTGVLAGMPVSVAGSVLDVKNPQVALAVRVPRATDPGLRRAFPVYATSPARLTAPAAVDLRILGPITGLVIDVTATTPGMRIAGYSLSNVRGQARYADRLIQIRAGSASFAGGTITSAGTIDLAATPTAYGFSGIATNVNLGQARLPAGLRVSGRGDVRFTAVRRGANLTADADVLLKNGKLFGISYNNLTATLRARNRTVQISQATLARARGTLRASGTVDLAGPVNLKVAGSAIDIAGLLQPFGVTGMTGTASFAGALSGTIKAPVLTAQVQAFRGRFQGLNYDFLRADVVATPQRITLNSVTARYYPARYTIAGEITLEKGHLGPVSLQVQSERLSAEYLLRLLNVQAPIKGSLSGSVRVTGRPGALGISGDFELTQGEILNVPISTASGSFVLSRGLLTLTNVIGRTDGGTFTIAGAVGPANNIALSLTASNIPLSLANRYTSPYLVTDGRADISAAVEGSSTNPTITATAHVAKLTLNKQLFDSFDATLSMADGRGVITNLSLVQDGSQYRITHGTMDLKARTVDLEAATQTAKLSTLLEMAINSPYLGTDEGRRLAEALGRVPRPIAGTLTSAISLHGPLRALVGSVAVSASQVEAGTVSLDTAVLNATLTGQEAIINQLSAGRGNAALKLNRGRIRYAGGLDLDLDVYNLPLASLNSFLPFGKQVSGQVDVLSLVVGGTVSNPVITSNFEMSNAVLAGLQFDRIRSTPIVIANGRAAVDEIILRRDNHGAVISGFVPVDIKHLQIPRDQPLMVHAQLTDQTLAVLPAFIPIIPSAEGVMTATVDVAGTLAAPTLNGLLTIENGTIRLPRIASPLRNIQARVALTGNAVQIERLTGSGASGTFAATGVADLNALPEPTINLKLTTTALELNEENLTGYRETFRGKLSSDLTIAGPWRAPLIGGTDGKPGTIRMFDAVFTVPSQAPTFEGPAPVYPVNPKFDLRMVLDGNVTLVGPLIRVAASGTTTLRGDLAAPQLVGHLTTSRGVVYYPSAVMRVSEGTADFSVMPPVPARIDLTARASTTIAGTQITMRVSGSLQNLKFDLTSQPPLPQQRLLALLLRQDQIEAILRGQDASTVLGAETLRILSAQLEPRVLMPFENAIQAALGLDEFAVDLGFFGTPSLVVSRRLFDGLYATYLRAFVGPGGVQERYRFTLSYRFGPTFQVGVANNNLENLRFIVEGSHRF